MNINISSKKKTQILAKIHLIIITIKLKSGLKEYQVCYFFKTGNMIPKIRFFYAVMSV